MAIRLPKLEALLGGQPMQARITWATIVRTAAEMRRILAMNLGFFIRLQLRDWSFLQDYYSTCMRAIAYGLRGMCGSSQQRAAPH